MNTTQELTNRTADRLKEAHGRRETDGTEPLFALVLALRRAGWTLQSIADPLDVSREIVRQWQKRAEEMELPTVTVESPPAAQVPKATIEAEQAEARRTARDRVEAEVLARNLPRMLELQPTAEGLRGPSMFNPQGAAASAEYTRLIDQTLKGGVRGRVLAEALGVQQITLHARLRRSGLRKTAPSEKVPSWATPGWTETA